MSGIEWVDLTVKDAPALLDFYKSVTGWQASPVSMGDYDDFNLMDSSTGQAVAGLCHARGKNKNIPPQWLIYIGVDDILKRVKSALALGAEIIQEPEKNSAAGKIYILKDPAGAIFALYEKRKAE